MLFNKGQKKENNNDSNVNNNTMDKGKYPKPTICLFDFDKETIKSLEEKYNVTSATLGDPIKIPNTKPNQFHICKLNYNYPKNLHEYDIISIDLSSKGPIKYTEKNEEAGKNKNDVDYTFISKFPQTVFEPRPYVSNFISKEINSKAILIVFASKKEIIKYNRAKIDDRGLNIYDTVKYNNYSFYKNMPVTQNKYGKEIKIITKHDYLNSLFNNVKEDIHYEIVFEHPTVWRKNQRIKRDNFIPLLKNKDHDIISFIDYNDIFALFLPQIKNKARILIPIVEEFLPDILPKYFPYSTKFKWLKHKKYWLPNHKKLLDEKQSIQSEYEEKLEKINEKIKKNENKYSFLHDMITETGENLVDAVKIYLEWLGFNEVIKMDDYNENIKEEDLQIELNNGLLVIEVKGIGGTSKDSDCNQINKIKYRRAEERDRSDVFGLYIVNHQRYLPPNNRENPPFTKNQIRDAKNEERGLLTTWDLFKSYYYIKDEIATKKEVRDKLTKYGLIDLLPNRLEYLGKTEEVFKNGEVFILELDDTKININDKLVIFKNEEYKIVKIVNIQINDEDVKNADSGEVGIKINNNIVKSSRVYLLKD